MFGLSIRRLCDPSILCESSEGDTVTNKPKKLNSRAKPTILIEYDSNLYKLLDITNGRIF